MNYKEQVDTMVAHLVQNISNDELFQFVYALGCGIASASLLVQDSQRAEFVDQACGAIIDEAKLKAEAFNALQAKFDDAMPTSVVRDAVRRDH